jgi:MGT family glycosyltransferase
MTPRRPLKLIFATWEGGGAVPPVMLAAQKMARRGHDVRVMSDACNRAEAEAASARFIPWTRAPNRLDKSRDSDFLRDWEAVGPEGLVRLLDKIVAGPALAYAEDISGELAGESADLVISSEVLLGVLAACEQLSQPAVALGVNICVMPLPGAPPFGGGLAPARTDAERAALEELAGDVRTLFDSGLPALNRARAALGLKPLAHLADQVLSAERYLIATSEAFDFPWTNRPAKVRYVGPLIADPSWASDWVSPWAPNDPRLLVLVGFSTTFQNHVGVLQRVLDALADLPVRVLLTCGEAIEPEELAPPANTQIVKHAPHVAVMREAGLVVTHGGHGTLIRALAAGLPMLVIPHGRDQVDNARRVTERGAGLSLDTGASVGEIRAAVHRLLEDPNFAAAARRLGATVADDAASNALVEALEATASVPAA